jgi:hypothetical protein
MCGIAAALCTLETVCFRYISVDTLHTGDDDDKYDYIKSKKYMFLEFSQKTNKNNY